MFTGLVEGRGAVVRISPEGPGVRLVIAPPEEMTGEGAPSALAQPVARAPVTVGESIAINGCCLTVIACDALEWAFQAGAETLSRTNLGRLRPGDEVNLERSLPVAGRLGGHFVQGHIDAVGTVESVLRDGDWVTMWFRVPPRLTRQMVAKGSIAVDGVSLTLVEVEAERFSVALIPHTLEQTTLGLRRVGDAVNVETDILGKYVEKLLGTP